MKNVIVMGYLYRISDAAFKRYLNAVISGDQRASEHLGDDKGYTYQTTDIGKEEAVDLLERVFGKKGTK